MSTEGIRRFQGWLADSRTIRDRVEVEAEVMLYWARGRTPVELFVRDFEQTRNLIREVARALAALDPAVSTDPVIVKGREIAPHLLRTEWCTADRVLLTCQHVVARMTTAEVFAVYAEVGMDNGKLNLDMGTARKMTAVEIARACCAAFAYRLFLAAANDDLKED